jgi:kynureninase
MISFYKPTPSRFKILLEAKAFPSDYYAIASQVSLHGFDPETSIIQVQPRKGAYTLETQDVLDVIKREGGQVCLIYVDCTGYAFWRSVLYGTVF